MYDLENPVCSMLKHPEVLEFLFRCTAVQTENATRFTPLPQYFCNVIEKPIKLGKPDPLNIGKDTVLDTQLFATTVYECNVKDICYRYQKIKRDNSLVNKGMSMPIYKLLEFVITTTTLNLYHTELYLKSQKFDNFKVLWSNQVEEVFIKSAKDDDNYKAGIKYLYHGSPLHNWHSIIRNGLKVMSGTTYMTTGAAYGNGIYLSDSMTMSYGYTRASKGMYGIAIVIGVYEVYNIPQYKKVNNIYVVPDDKKLLLRYLLYIENPSDICLLDKHMGTLLNKRSTARVKMLDGNETRRNARITKELKILECEPGFKCTSSNDAYTVEYENTIFELRFPQSYPSTPPIISINGLTSCDQEWSVGWKLAPYIMTIYHNQDRLNTKV